MFLTKLPFQPQSNGDRKPGNALLCLISLPEQPRPDQIVHLTPSFVLPAHVIPIFLIEKDPCRSRAIVSHRLHLDPSKSDLPCWVVFAFVLLFPTKIGFN